MNYTHCIQAEAEFSKEVDKVLMEATYTCPEKEIVSVNRDRTNDFKF